MLQLLDVAAVGRDSLCVLLGRVLGLRSGLS